MSAGAVGGRRVSFIFVFCRVFVRAKKGLDETDGGGTL